MQEKRIIALRFVIVSIICMVAILLLSVGCKNHSNQYRIGLSQCLDDAWRQKMNEEMERELLLHPGMSITRRVAYGSNELQCAQIDSFIAERVDLLIVSPNEAEEVKPAVTRAYRAGIPVIVADRRVSGDEWTAFIGGDNYRVGELMGEWIMRLQSEATHPLHVLEVSGLPGSTPATLRHKGMMDKLTSQRVEESTSQRVGVMQPRIETVLGEWYRETAYAVVADYLSKHRDVDVIVAQNDLMAIGASEAVRHNKAYASHKVHVMGVDGIQLGLQAVAEGNIDCTATYSSRGDMVIETAAQILAGQPFVRDTVLETALIDEETARPMLIQYSERIHDLETFRIVKVNSDLQWQQMMSSRQKMIVLIVIVIALFLAALGGLVYFQLRIQREISKEILPQLEDVQEAIQLSKRDEAFAERLRQIVDEHLTDPNLNVEYLGSMLGLSRTQIFRRVKTVTGKGPLDYIRERRLERADQLLKSTDMTVQQVAIELCFSTPSYFTKCYKDYFKHLPSER